MPWVKFLLSQIYISIAAGVGTSQELTDNSASSPKQQNCTLNILVLASLPSHKQQGKSIHATSNNWSIGRRRENLFDHESPLIPAHKTANTTRPSCPLQSQHYSMEWQLSLRSPKLQYDHALLVAYWVSQGNPQTYTHLHPNQRRRTSHQHQRPQICSVFNQLRRHIPLCTNTTSKSPRSNWHIPCCNILC